MQPCVTRALSAAGGGTRGKHDAMRAGNVRASTYPACASSSRLVDCRAKGLWASYATSVSLDALLGVGATVGAEHTLERVDAIEKRFLDACGEHSDTEGVGVSSDSTLPFSR